MVTNLQYKANKKRQNTLALTSDSRPVINVPVETEDQLVVQNRLARRRLKAGYRVAIKSLYSYHGSNYLDDDPMDLID